MSQTTHTITVNKQNFTPSTLDNVKGDDQISFSLGDGTKTRCITVASGLFSTTTFNLARNSTVNQTVLSNAPIADYGIQTEPESVDGPIPPAPMTGTIKVVSRF